MSMQDPIADMLTRIRNSQAVGEKQIRFPASKLKKSILSVMKAEGYIEDFSEMQIGSTNKKDLSVTLKYYQGRPVINKIKRVSTPGLRIYRGSKNMPVVRAGMGVALVTTSKGIMTERAARAQKLGGEIICEIE